MTAAILLLSLALAQPPQAPAPDHERPGTAQVRGRIVEKETGRPLPRAVVAITSMNGGESATTTADDDGRYELTGLRAGTYVLSASLPTHRATHVRQGFVEPDGRAGRVVLKDGESRDRVDVALPRALSLDVRVVDEWGEPLWGLEIKLANAATGDDVHPMISHRTTDDRGMVRMFALEAGRYVACAEDPFFNAASAERAARERFVRTCYPSAPDRATAEPVNVRPGEPAEIEIRMRRNRTFTVSGTVLGASGLPEAGAHVSLITTSGSGSASTGIYVGPDARFAAKNVPAGTYALSAEVGAPHSGAPGGSDREAAYMKVTVGSADVEGLVLAMVKAVDIPGRVTTDDPSRPVPRGEGPGIMVLAHLAATNSLDSGSIAMTLVDTDQTFVLSGMYGARRLAIANTPPGWYVKSVRYRGGDVADAPLEVAAGKEPSSIEIVLSARGATLSGRVTDEAGNPVKGGRIVVMPADPARRTIFEIDDAGILPTGMFRIGPMRRGEYLLAALEAAGFADMWNPEMLAKIAESAERVTLGDEEERSIDLRIVRIR